MKDYSELLHKWFNNSRRFYFPFDKNLEEIPLNGIYILFEKGEKYKDWDRIVRVGTHNGKNQLRSRLQQHFMDENKDRSIFRKHIGRCYLNKEGNSYIDIWDLDNTKKADRLKNEQLVNKHFQMELEKKISKYIQTNLSFTVFEVHTKELREFWERKIIGTISLANTFKSSNNWLGLCVPPKQRKISESGLWNIKGLYKDPINEDELVKLRNLIGKQR